MSKKKQKISADSIDADYYKLNTKAVNDLVDAQDEVETADEITQQHTNNEAKKYQKSFLNKLPVWFKALFVKYWFNGAICFFFIMGLGLYIKAQLDLLVVTALAMGVLTDILLNNILRFMNSANKEYDKYMMLPMKKYWTLFLNIPYAFVVFTAVVFTYTLANSVIISSANLPVDSVPLQVEPLLFGLVYLLYDMLFISVKNAIVRAVKSAKSK